MLILTRKIGETLKIGDEVDIVILGSKGGQVRLGINAPRTISIHRLEVYNRILNEVKEPQKPVEQLETDEEDGA